MKNLSKNIYAILIGGTIITISMIVIIIMLARELEYIKYNNYPKIELPEEYQAIKATDTLKGYYNSEGVLVIEFNNKRNQK